MSWDRNSFYGSAIGVHRSSADMGVTESGMRSRKARERAFLIGMLVLWCACAVFLLLYGDQVYSPLTVLKVLAGQNIKGAAYSVKTIRLPRVLVGTLAGFAFGAAGNTFQKILRNALASPDVMGITSGASAAAVFSTMVLGLSGMVVSVIALLGGAAVATVILIISQQKGFSVNKMILTGIGIQAMLQAVINFIILKTSNYNIADALRWLSGSLNGVRINDVSSFGFIVVICVAVIVACERDLQVLGLGEELPVTLGMNTVQSRRFLIYSAVILCAGTTAVTGPLSSVAFMSGHIAGRLLKTGGAGTVHAGCIGAILVLVSEAAGQFAFSTRYPVGVITGIIGAPYLIYLLTSLNHKNG